MCVRVDVCVCVCVCVYGALTHPGCQSRWWPACPQEAVRRSRQACGRASQNRRRGPGGGRGGGDGDGGGGGVVVVGGGDGDGVGGVMVVIVGRYWPWARQPVQRVVRVLVARTFRSRSEWGWSGAMAVEC